jgi:DNA-binding SARP family transcriptional activator/anti-anti-sigma regulatory factor
VSDVRFTVLGRVGIALDGADVPIVGRRERAVLAVLLAARREVVSVDRLIEDIWGSGAANGSRASLQVAVSHLRALLEPDRDLGTSARTLVRSGAGYAMGVPAGSVDSERFADLVDDAHRALSAGEPERAWALCEESEEIWSGTPFADVVDSPQIRAERTRLEDLRLSAVELGAEALLALGRHALVTGRLEALVVEHPYRERLWEFHALALYRSGRQADALDTLRRAREVLVEDLGIDPSPALQQLEAGLLAQDPALAQPPVRPTTRPQRQPSQETQPDRSVLIGRAEMMRQLEDALGRSVADGTGQTVLVSGEPGIGKTRLLAEFADIAKAQGARVLWGRSHEADMSPAYWPWLPVIRELADARSPKPVAELLSPGGAAGTIDAESAALRTYDAVSRLIAAASHEAPVVVLLEDVHWADDASLQLLAFAAEALRQHPTVLVATVRDIASPHPALRECLAALGRLSVLRMPLRGLVSEQVGELVRSLTAGTVDDELASVVAERTDGNPFFVIELVWLLASEQRLHAEGAREIDVPHGVQDVLRCRLERLPERVRALLGVAAVTGRDFDVGLIAGVSRTDPEDALDLLDEAVAAHAVQEAEPPGHYRFVHALVRDVLYGSLSRTRRTRLHAGIAVALEARLANDPELIAEVAHHFVLASALRPDLAETAVRHAVAAAQYAESRDALDQALVHWEQALTAEARAPGAQPRRRYDVLVGLGRARYRRGDVTGSRDALDAAVDMARNIGDCELRAEAATVRGAGVWHWREFGTSDPPTVALLEECAAELPEGALHARVLANLAMELTYEWRSAEADAIGRRAVDMARAVANDDLFVDVVPVRTLALWGKPGAVPERLALAEEVLRRPLSQEQELYDRFGAAAAHMQAGNPGEAERHMTRCVELARRLRHTGADIPIAWWLFYRAVDSGDVAEAERLRRVALKRHQRSSVVAISDMEPMAALRMAAPGAPVPDEYVETARQHANPAFRALVAHALAEAGRAGEGADLLGAPVPDGAWDYSSMYGDCLRVDVFSAAGRTEELRGALARIQPWAHEFAMYGSTDCAGSIDYFVGRGLEGLGDAEGARLAYGRAAAGNRTAGIVPWQQRAEQRLNALR